MSTEKTVQKKVVVATIAKPTQHQKKNESPTIQEKNEAKEIVKSILSVQTPEQRIGDLKILNKLSEKVEHLQKLQNEFKMFVASSDETANKFTLENSQGFKFLVTNSTTLSKIIALIDVDLKEVNEKAQMEFLNFKI